MGVRGGNGCEGREWVCGAGMGVWGGNGGVGWEWVCGVGMGVRGGNVDVMLFQSKLYFSNH